MHIPMSKVVSRMTRSALGLAFVLCTASALLAQSAPQNQPTQSAAPVAARQAPDEQTPPGTQDQNGTPTIGVTVNEVYLVFSVTDRHGHFISNLKQSDFALLDDHRAPAQIYSFTQQTNLPLRVGIMIDTSSSIRSRFDYEQQAATSFLLQVLRPAYDRAFIEGFDVTPDYRTAWTNNLDALTAGIQSLHPGGGTALYDAVYAACRDRMLSSRGQEPLRKALILVSDGDDNQSHAYLEDAIRECQRADTKIYAISTNVGPSRDKGDDILKKMAITTGGRAYFPTSMDNMPVSFQEIQNELRSQYALVYKPADFKADGQFRPIYLFCLDRRYQVRVREGYYAPKG